MTRTELINRVKIKLDEYAPTPTEGALPFDSYIGPLLDESARDLLERAPLRLMAPSGITLTSTAYANDKSYILVPTDYVRLYEMKYPLWKKAVRVAISSENPNYNIQENEYLKAGYGRPNVAIVLYSALKHFECAKVLSGATPDVATYVKTDVAENLNDQLADSLTWLCTEKVLNILGYLDKAKMANGRFNDSLSVLIV